MGDLVDLGEAVGVVEDVTLRITRLRDLGGVVWYVRNGEILRVANQSQGWVLAAVDIPVAYDENLDKVRRTIEAVAEDMYGDPLYDDMLLGAHLRRRRGGQRGGGVHQDHRQSRTGEQIPLTRAIRAQIRTHSTARISGCRWSVRPFPPGAAGNRRPSETDSPHADERPAVSD